jgi:hypothetical protein
MNTDMHLRVPTYADVHKQQLDARASTHTRTHTHTHKHTHTHTPTHRTHRITT